MEALEPWIVVGFVMWVATGVVALANQLMVYRRENARQKVLLSCEYAECRNPADNLWVFEDDIRGVCDMHYAIEQEMTDDGEG